MKNEANNHLLEVGHNILTGITDTIHGNFDFYGVKFQNTNHYSIVSTCIQVRYSDSEKTSFPSGPIDVHDKKIYIARIQGESDQS